MMIHAVDTSTSEVSWCEPCGYICPLWYLSSNSFAALLSWKRWCWHRGSHWERSYKIQGLQKAPA